MHRQVIASAYCFLGLDERLAALTTINEQKLLGDAAGRYAALYKLFDGQPAVQKQLAARGTAALSRTMARLGFELVEAYDAPFVIREHRRKFQFGVSHVTVFRLQ